MDIEASYSPSNGGTGRKTRKSMLLAALPDLSDEENDKNDAEKEDVKPKGSRLSGVSRRSSVGGRRLSGFGARRRSSMGLLTGKGEKRTAAEQQKLVEMYRMAIKMSSENKVSAKNAWNLNLIDTLDEVVEMEDESTVDATAKSERRRSRGGGRRGLSVNFQRASCALEAGVRIYSCRVDDTHTRSMRVLENLARGSGGRRGPADGGLDDDDGDGEGEGEGAAGKKRRPVRAAAVATLEKNRANIDAPNVEAHAAVDPLFHKMSRAFDEGGARGMLLANLGVARGSRVMFDSGEGAEEEERPAGGGGGGDWAAPVDCSGLAELVRQRQEQAAAAGERPGELCPGLGALRRELGALVELDLEAALERPPRAADAAAGDAGAGGGGGAEEEAVEGLADQLAAGLALGGPGGDDSLFQEDDFGDGGVDFGFDNDDFEDNNMVGTGPEDSYYEAPHRGGLRAAVARLSLMPGAGAGAGASYRQSVARPVAARLLEGVTGDQFIRDEYNFFDAVALGKNQWAGASHWKFAAQKSKLAGGTVAAALPEEDGEEEGEEEAGGGAGGGRGRRKKKEAFAFDFLGGPPVTLADLELPQPPAKGKRAAAADPTVQTAAALAKNAAAADRGELLLPQDAHVQARDLVRLFLRPSAYVSRARRGLMYSLPDPAGAAGYGAGGGGGGGGGFFGAGAGAQDLNGPEDDDDEGAGFDFDAGGEDFGEEDFHGDDAAAGAYQALFLNGGDDLVTADRRVEKIEINYARTAKKVDVRQLKKQLWKEINTTLGVERGGTAAEGADNSLAFAGSQTAFEGPALGEGAEFRATTTFRDMIAGCAAASAVQSEVTVPFYFICALHLANEKGLHFEAASEMDNFVIKAATGSNPQ